jgi:hypothetical protein
VLLRKRRPSGDRGSVLALVPAGFLVLIALGALAVDSAVAYLGQQQLHDALVAAANDAASSAIDHSAFYGSGSVVISLPAAQQVVCESVLQQHVSQLHQVKLWLAVNGTEVRVIGEAEVDAVFGRAIPGFGTRHVRAVVDAVATTAPGQKPEPTPLTVAPLACS